MCHCTIRSYRFDAKKFRTVEMSICFPKRHVNTIFLTREGFTGKIEKSESLDFAKHGRAVAEPVINEWHAFDWAWLVKRDSLPYVAYIPWSEQIYLELSWNAASKVIFVKPSLYHPLLRYFLTSRWKSDNVKL